MYMNETLLEQFPYKQCKQCDQPFMPKDKRSYKRTAYCSPGCQKQAARELDRQRKRRRAKRRDAETFTCETCGVEGPRNRSTQRFCSSECSRRMDSIARSRLKSNLRVSGQRANDARQLKSLIGRLAADKAQYDKLREAYPLPPGVYDTAIERLHSAVQEVEKSQNKFMEG